MTSRVDRINRGLAIALGLFFVAVPWLLPLFASNFWVNVTAEILIWSLLAASVNLLFGYVGLLSFGQALFFGLGMYGVTIGVAKFGLGFWPAFGLEIGVSVLMSFVIGIFAVRLTWHYFAIITVVFSQIFYFLALTWKSVTGGDDGMSFSMPPMLSVGEFEISLTDQTYQYFFILVVVALSFYLKYRLLQSPLGKALIAVRENDARAELIGLNVYGLRLTAFVIAGFLTGTAGALFAFLGRYASASYMFYQVSGEGVVWTIIGGAGTLLGPVVGTGLLIILREELSTYWEYSLIPVGVIVILAVIFAPKGIVGLYNDLLERWFGADDESRPVSRPQPSEPARLLSRGE